MFDFARVSEFSGGSLGQTATRAGRPDAVQHFAEQDIDYGLLRDLGAEDIFHLLLENGIEPSQLDAGQLHDIVDETSDSEWH